MSVLFRSTTRITTRLVEESKVLALTNYSEDNVLHKVVHNRHRLVRYASIWVNLFQYTIDVSRELIGVSVSSFTHVVNDYGAEMCRKKNSKKGTKNNRQFSFGQVRTRYGKVEAFSV